MPTTEPIANKFEGPEKKLEVCFVPKERGLRSLCRPTWDAMMDDACCTIVSVLSNDDFDAYLLSESSLFVYNHKLMIKTCGTTALLHILPRLLFEAGKLDLHVDFVQFSRSNFNEPDLQPEVHQHFDNEVNYLKQFFPEGKAFVLGPLNSGYHLFVADYTTTEPCEETQQTFEVIMNNLDKDVMEYYFQDKSPNAEYARITTGIDKCMPKAHIDDFLFEPCGYSLNALEGDAYYTIHITPEAGFSYVSFETNLALADYSPLLDTVVKTFKPGNFCAVVFADMGAPASKASLECSMDGYVELEASRTRLCDQSVAYFANFMHQIHHSPKATPKHSLSIVNPVNVVGAMDKVGAKFDIHHLTTSVTPFIKEKAEIVGDDNSFYVCDLYKVAEKYIEFCTNLPRVEPHYAVKCNPNDAIIHLLASLGAGFDCASQYEIDKVLSAGVDPKRIIYANPCKLKKQIKHAREVGVETTTFDNVAELRKIAELNPNARLVLRLFVNDEDSICRMSQKYGARREAVPELLQVAKELNLNIVGCSFHVGSGLTRVDAFEEPLHYAAWVFKEAPTYGFNMTLLDIGGGFPGDDNVQVTFGQVAKAIRPTLDALFPPSIRVIAEPGRFFAHSAFTLATKVFSKRVEDQHRMYYINDGVYGSFNCKLYDHVDKYYPSPLPKNSKINAASTISSTIFGPTCDGLDTIVDEVDMPELEVDDLITWPAMGAYTIAAATTFNGFALPTVFYVNSGMNICK